MRWFAWGKQSSIYGIPLGVALIMIGFLMLFNVAELYGLFLGGKSYIDLYGACHIKLDGFQWPSLRWFWFIKIFTQVLWAITIAATVAIWRQGDTLRKLMLTFPWIYFAEMSYFLGYAFYAFYFPEERLLYEQEMWFLKRYQLNKGPLAWPKKFYVVYPLVCVGYFYFFTLIWDCHLSYHRVLEVGGSGFENKAFYQIHLQSADTVETLSDWWNNRLGIEKKVRRSQYDDEEEGGGRPHESSPMFAA